MRYDLVAVSLRLAAAASLALSTPAFAQKESVETGVEGRVEGTDGPIDSDEWVASGELDVDVELAASDEDIEDVESDEEGVGIDSDDLIVMDVDIALSESEAGALPVVPEELSSVLEPTDTERDAPEIREDVTKASLELVELHAAESVAIDGFVRQPRHIGRLGPGNPIRHRAFDAMLRPGSSLLAGAVVPEGDAGDLLEELGGIDLAELKARYDIPIEINDEVIRYIRFFQNNGRKWFSRWLSRSHRWIPVLQPILAEEGLPLDTVYLAMIESGFSPYAYSWARASGMWQFMPATGRRFRLRNDFWVDERRDPVRATRAAAQYLRILHSEFGHWYLAWAGYNAGEGKMRRAIRMYDSSDFWELCDAGNYLKPETKHYVPKLIAAAIIAKHPERFGFDDVEPEELFDYDEVEVADATDLAVIAEAAGVDIEAVRSLNPALRRWATPPVHRGRGYTVKLPTGTAERFLAEFSKIAPSERLTFRHHKVRRGDTLSHLSRQYGMPVEAIMRANNIRNARSLRAGQNIIIPLPAQAAGNRRSTSSSASASRSNPPQGADSTSSRYTIRRGDTLWSIARRFGVEVEDLKRWNSLPRGSDSRLQVGQVLVVSAR